MVELRVEVVATSQKLEEHAACRAEVLAAQRGLQSPLAEVGRQSDNLDAGRRGMSRLRYTESLMSPAVLGLALVLACLCPRGIAVYALRVCQTSLPEAAVMSDLLVTELTSATSRLLLSSCGHLEVSDPHGYV
ncbi:MAG: hypothetical protein U0992_05365 [Planctomycetaceae bacterium]